MAIFLFFCLLSACSPESKEDSQPEAEQTQSETRGEFSSKNEADPDPETTQSDVPIVEVPLEVIPAAPEKTSEPEPQIKEEPEQEEQAPVVEQTPPVVEEAPPVVEEPTPVIEETPPAAETPPPVVEEAPPAAEPQQEIVYITNTGSKYHRSGCRHLQDSKIEIEKDTAIAQGYEPCKTCH